MTNAMTYRGYTASMTFDPEDHIIVGRVEGIDDIVTFHWALNRTRADPLQDHVAPSKRSPRLS